MQAACKKIAFLSAKLPELVLNIIPTGGARSPFHQRLRDCMPILAFTVGMHVLGVRCYVSTIREVVIGQSSSQLI